MNHVKALVLKFGMIAVVLLVILTLIFDVEFEKTLLISLVLTIVAYLIGDLMVFRKTGNKESDARTGQNHSAGHGANADYKKRNIMATVGDIVIAFLVIWLLGDALIDNAEDIVTAALISALVIGGGEWFFHKYLDKNVFPEKDGRASSGNARR